jgi:hypothetical protein
VKRGDAGYMGNPSVILTVQKQPSADTLRLTKEIEAAPGDLKRVLPKSIPTVDVLLRQASFIQVSIDNVLRVLVEALVVVAVVLFLMNWRTPAISLTAIPISVLMTLIVFHLFGLTINTTTLGGLAIGRQGHESDREDRQGRRSELPGQARPAELTFHSGWPQRSGRMRAVPCQGTLVAVRWLACGSSPRHPLLWLALEDGMPGAGLDPARHAPRPASALGVSRAPIYRNLPMERAELFLQKLGENPAPIDACKQLGQPKGGMIHAPRLPARRGGRSLRSASRLPSGRPTSWRHGWGWRCSPCLKAWQCSGRHPASLPAS